MLERRSGDIVNIASAGGTRGIPNWSGYCASKFAVVGFAQALAQEVAELGIRVHTLCPGGIDTPFWDDLNEPYAGDRSRLMPAESVAELVLAVLAQPQTVLMRQALFFPVNEWH
jgi:3-oxoacyl-[acyl-carrier protein] reductase